MSRRQRLKRIFRKRHDHHRHLVTKPPLSHIPEAKDLPETPPARKKDKHLKIHVYDGYGTTEHLEVYGRLVSDRKVDMAEEHDSRMRNLFKTSRRFIPRGAEEIWITLSFGPHQKEALTQDNGFFFVTFQDLTDMEPGAHKMTVELSARNPSYYQAKPGFGHFILHPPHSTATGVISDIDDTILLTEAHSKVRMMRNVLFKNYKTQEPIEGMNQIFHAIHQGPLGDGYDATHYVSSSPYNLYSRINQFLEYRGFPEGSINLKNWGFGKDSDSLFDHEKYKLNKIRQILLTYPQRTFILFGDSGEHDPEIYRKIYLEFPGQIMAMYIHNVSGDDKEDLRYKGQFLFNTAHEVEMDLRQKGWID